MLDGGGETEEELRVRRSLDGDSAATLVYSFVTSRVDYCNAILAEWGAGNPSPTSFSEH